ncbi:MAG TPA: hypothetical protein VE046_17675 [Steroidobacteraceae bacterium]|nr:hypothetical protein [Steroidobacteraceae bacterium]
MERLLLVLDELDDVVSVLRHLWLGVSTDFARLAAWAMVVILPGVLIYADRV